ncbi:hypothetical protein PMAYCL1PPCAC_13760, partial [Pristionchus mayeri]
EAWEQNASDEITEECAVMISERKTEIVELCSKRPKWTINFDLRGELYTIVCSLFNDVHPVVVQSFIDHLSRYRKEVYNHGGALPKVFVTDRLQKDDTCVFPLFEHLPQQQQPAYYYLMYFDFVNGPYARICDQIYSNGWLLGVVTAGAELFNGNYGYFTTYEFA